MNFDRNTVMGFIVLALLFGGYFWWTSKEQAAAREKKQDRIITRQGQKLIPSGLCKQNKILLPLSRIHYITLNRLKQSGRFQKAVLSPEKLLMVDNGVLSITFTSKGGQPKEVELKNSTVLIALR